MTEANQLFFSVADPDPLDPYVFGAPRSGSVSQRYGSGSGSGSFYHQAKIVRLLYDFLSLKNDVSVASKTNKQNLEKKLIVLLPS
jgi:hypothetical protein